MVTRLGIYESLTEIGRGGMATVYRAYQPSVDRYVAIKVIEQDFTTEGLVIERFQREARMIARLEHPHILPIYDFDGTHTPPYIVMRFLDGVTLKDIIRSYILPLDEASLLVRQIASALDYAHRAGAVHRDVKPSNIMVDKSGNAFLTDFGIARLASREDSTLTQAGALLGTPRYISPEQARDSSSADARADLYSFAAVIFELLTGHAPFEAENLMSLLMQHISAPVPSASLKNQALPPAVDAVFMRALAKLPQDRYESATAFADALIHALGGKVASTPAVLRTVVEAVSSGEELPSTDTRSTGSTRIPDQQRQITALYASLTEMAEVLLESQDGESVARTMRDVLANADRAIAASGGLLYERTTESFLAVWGIEGAREDDPERTIRAALSIREGVLGITTNAPIQMGINTGMVIQQAAQPGHETERNVPFTLMGQALLVVKRLEQAAPPGGILIGYDTYRHVIGIFDVVAEPPIRIRGRKDPLEVYSVIRARPRAFRLGTRGIEGIETRMVGRESELKQLQDALLLALEDRETQVVTCVGEAGIGKSRLLYEFSKWLDSLEHQVRFFQGRAIQQTSNMSYALLRDLFAFRFEILDSDSLPVMRQKFEKGIAGFLGEGSAERAHLIAHLVGFDFSDSPHVKAVIGNARIFKAQATEYLIDLMRAVATISPTLILLEDIHWADSASLDVIDQIVTAHPKLALMVLCMARPDLYQHRSGWGEGQSFHRRIELKPLSKVDSRRLVREVLQRVEDMPTELRDLVVEQAEGNPFYIEELIKVLIEDGVIIKKRKSDDDGAKVEVWQVVPDQLSRVRVPPSLTGVLQARLDLLPPPARLLLGRAAVIGRVFWDTALQSLSTADSTIVPNIDTLLADLRARELIFQRETSTFAGAREYVIKHAILRDVIYGSMLKGQQRAYHKAAAEWLLSISGARVKEFTVLIAEHYERADENILAATQYLSAARTSIRTSSFAEATKFAERALSLLTSLDTPEARRLRGDALLQKGIAVGVTVGLSEGLAIISEAVDLARQVKDGSVLSEALAHIGLNKLWQGKYTEAYAALQEGLPIAREVKNRSAELNILRQLGNTLVSQGKSAEAMPYYEESLALARQEGDLFSIANTLSGMGDASQDQPPEVALRYYAEALEAARAGRHIYGVAMVLSNMSAVELRYGRLDDALRHVLEGTATAKRIASGGLIVNGLSMTAILYVEMDRFDEAREVIQEAAHIQKTVGDTPVLLTLLFAYALLQVKSGKADSLPLIGLAFYHPATDAFSLKLMQELFAKARAKHLPQIPQAEVDAALDKGKTLDVTEAARALDTL